MLLIDGKVIETGSNLTERLIAAGRRIANRTRKTFLNLPGRIAAITLPVNSATI
jgi:hypothetical protein